MTAPRTFHELNLPQALASTCEEVGYRELTPIQAASLPHTLAGRDLIGQAKTGSGKTASFALPLLVATELKPRAIQGLVLCPTRELCTQVAGEIRKLARKLPGLQVLIVSGGQPIGPQLAALKRGVHVVVGTPGRVLDHLGRQSLELSRIRTLVLDEADRMLEMGFQEDMERILASIPRDRQTLLFSATFPSTIEAMSRAYQRNPERVTIEPEPESLTSIEQSALVVEADSRIDSLIRLLEARRPPSAIVFCNFKTSVIAVAEALSAAGASVAALHGDLEQFDRDRVMARFRNGSVRILVATDVAARGIDVPQLDAVYNFELPSQPEVYVHRIGRTGRAGASGYAVSLLTASEQPKLESIERLTGHPIPLLSAQTTSSVSSSAASLRSDAGARMETLRISGGRKDKVRPGDILGALTGEAGGLASSDVGKIEIHDHHSFVAVTAAIAAEAAHRLRNGRIKGRKFRIDIVR